MQGGLIQKQAEENRALFLHLHLVQEELERLHAQHKQQDIRGEGKVSPWSDDELSETLAENQRLQAAFEMLRYVHSVELNNSLSIRLGNLLQQALKSLWSHLTLLRTVRKAKLAASQTISSESLGGETFRKVITAYEQGNLEAVDALLTTVAASYPVRANAYTALARYLMQCDMLQAVEAARRAYEEDPRPYRLKWLGFRLYDAGFVIEAEAIFDILPADISMSESESRQVTRLRVESKTIRKNKTQR